MPASVPPNEAVLLNAPQKVSGESDPAALKPVEAELAEALERERAAHARIVNILESMGDAFVALDTDWRYTYMNRKAGQIFNRRPEEMLGKHIWTEFPEGIGQPFYHAYYKAVETQQPIFLEEYYPPYARWFENRIYPSPDGLAIFFQDVTDRKRAEYEVRRKNRALTALSACNQALIRAQDERVLLNEICRICVEVGGYRMAWVGYAEHDENKTVRPVAQQGFEQGYLDTVNITWADVERGRGPTGTAIRTGQPSVARNIPENPDYAPWRAAAIRRGYVASVALPLMANGKTLGALNIYSTEAKAFDTAELELLMELAGDLAYGIVSLRTRVEHARAEEQLHFQANLIATVQDAVIATDMQFNIQFWNAAAEVLYGWTAAEVVGRPMAVFIQNEYLHDTREESIRAVTEKGFWRGEVTQNRRDGMRAPILATVTLLKDARGQPTGFVAINRDITERKRAEQVLRESEERLARIVETVPEGITIVNREGQITFANAAAERILGLTRGDITDRAYDDPGWRITAVDGSPFPPEELPFAKVMWSGQPVYGVEHAIERPDGHRVVLSINAAPLHETNGEIGGMVAAITDITERKLAEAALRQSEQKFSALFDKAAFATSLSRLPDGIIVDVNQAFERALGYTKQEVVGKTSLELGINPESESRARIIAAFEDQGSVRNQELTLRTKSGEPRVFSVNTDLVEIGGQKLLLNTTQDVTERKQAEAALRESEERYRQLVDTSPYAIGVHQDGRLKFVNPAACRLLGAQHSGQLIGKPISEIVHPEGWAVARDRIQRMLAGEAGLYPAEDRYVRIDGRAVPVEVTSAPFIYQGRPALQVIALDITERKRAEEAVRRNEQILRLFVENSPAAIAMFDREMKYIVASRRFLVDYDLGEQNLVGRSHYEVFPEISERWLAIHRRCLAGATEKAEEDPFPRADGRLDWVRWEIRPWYETGGDIGGLILFSEVITERKRAAEEVRKLNAELEQRVAERTAELKEQYRRQATLEERQRLARDLHDVVSQTLFSASVIAETLPRLWERDPEQVRRGLNELHRLTRGALAEMRALLLELRPEAMDRTSLADLLGHLANALTGRTQLEVSLTAEPIPPLPTGIRLGLYRIAQEALNNVVKHAHAERVHITLAPAAGATGVRLGIRDDGRGFDTASAPPGHLGLGIMRERAEAVGAALAVHSQPGAGTEVVVTWPGGEG